MIEVFKKLLNQKKRILEGRSKFYRMKFENLETDADEMQRFDKAKFQLRKLDDHLEKVKKELDKLAEDLPVEQSKNWHKYDAVWESTYSSQGFGSYKYAKERAQKIVDDVNFKGVSAKVEVKTEHYSGRGGAPFFSPRSHSTFTVYVKADKLNREILKRKPGISFKEWIRLCWKRGVNPRVYNPLLPVGIEERLGLDYFGNEVK